jgi:tetratricopeptide (TPR) repeat protein
MLLLHAQILLTQRRGPEAVAQMERTVDRYPTADKAWFGLAGALGAVQDFGRAEKVTLKAIELAPEKTQYRFFLGIVRQQRRHYKEAAAAFREAIQLRPGYAEAHFKLGECLRELGERDTADHAFRDALRFRPDMNEARAALAKLDKGRD